MKNPINFLIGLLVAFVLGVMLGAKSYYNLSSTEAKKLKEKIAAREAKIDSLRAVSVILADSLQNAHTVTTIETIKYYEIKPKSYSSASFDSLLRANFGE